VAYLVSSIASVIRALLHTAVPLCRFATDIVTGSIRPASVANLLRASLIDWSRDYDVIITAVKVRMIGDRAADLRKLDDHGWTLVHHAASKPKLYFSDKAATLTLYQPARVCRIKLSLRNIFNRYTAFVLWCCPSFPLLHFMRTSTRCLVISPANQTVISDLGVGWVAQW